MIMTVKTTKKIIALIFHVFLILASTLSWAGDVFFSDYPVRILKVLEVNEEAQTVVFESPDGITATLAVGDIVGQESTTIIEVKKLIIVVEQTSDETGETRKSGIPVIPIESPVLMNVQ